MSYARPIYPGTTYLVTRRTERRHCLLRPDAKTNQFILFALIVSAIRYGVLIHAFCAMSTHMHYVITDPLGQLPRFLAMFHRLVALGIKALNQWDGAVWDRSQTSVVALCTRQAIVEKIAYTLANPVAAGLVRRAHEWPGAKTSVDDIAASDIDARRPEVYFSRKNAEWQARARIDVSLPPSIDQTNADSFRRDIKTEIAKLEETANVAFTEHSVLGAKHATEVSPEHRILSVEPILQRNPTFAVGRSCESDIRLAILARIRSFRMAYADALRKWRLGERSVVFPHGTYAMRVIHMANVASQFS